MVGQPAVFSEINSPLLGKPPTDFMHEKPAFSTINYSRVIHLSHGINPQIPQWPNDPPVEFEPAAELDKDGYYLRRFSMGEHSATHINAPNSFHADGVGI